MKALRACSSHAPPLRPTQSLPWRNSCSSLKRIKAFKSTVLPTCRRVPDTVRNSFIQGGLSLLQLGHCAGQGAPLQAVRVFQPVCHSHAITGVAFVANLSVCYLAWKGRGSCRGTSGMIFNAQQWLDHGSVLIRLEPDRQRAPRCAPRLATNFKFRLS